MSRLPRPLGEDVQLCNAVSVLLVDILLLKNGRKGKCTSQSRRSLHKNAVIDETGRPGAEVVVVITAVARLAET
jgi:hypothetical protein